MSKTQTRRCVSLSRPVYDFLREYCLKNNCSMSGVVEKLILRGNSALAQSAEALSEAIEVKVIKSHMDRHDGNVKTF